MSVRFYIDYLAHATGVAISTYEVLKPEYSFNLSDMGTCSWNLALSQQRVDGGPIVQDEFAPKSRDYLLRGNDGIQNVKLQSGRLLDVGLESDTGLIACSGKDWLEYLDQPWYFGSSAGHGYQADLLTLKYSVDDIVKVFVATAGTDTPNVVFGSTQQKIINAILAHANLLSPGDIQYTANYAGTGWGQVLEYEIQFLDETTLLSHIQAVSSYADPLGFDFWCDWDKKIYFYSPRLVINPSSPAAQTILTLVYGVDPVVKVVWHNAGPKATRTVGKNSVNIWKERSFAGSISTYRDELEVIDLGQKFDSARTLAAIQHQVDVATDAVGSFDWNPQKDLTLTVLPDRLFPSSEVDGFKSMLGKAISFDSGNEFMPYHRINASYYIVSQTYRTDDDSGNFILDLGLQQIYG